MYFPGGSDLKESSCNAGDPSSIPGLGRSPGKGATHFSILAWRIPRTEWAIVHGGRKQSDTNEHEHACMHGDTRGYPLLGPQGI